MTKPMSQPLPDPAKGEPDPDKAKSLRQAAWARPKTKATRDKWRAARVNDALAAMEGQA